MNPGETAFYDNAVPALEAGDYQFVIEQTVTVDHVVQPPYGTAQRFRVTGPRTALGPSDVVAMRPAAGSQGSYQSWLPHVVLAQRTLPWQVAVAEGPTVVSAPPGTPWMALLLLTAAEIDVAGHAPTPGTTGRQVVGIAQLLAPPSGIAGPAATPGLNTLVQEQPDLTIGIVDIHLDAFRAIAPTVADLPLLTHVRQVDASDQEALDVSNPGWYSVVVGNRFPTGAPDNTYVAHLVSLEGAVGYLPGGSAITVADRLRLVSLASWSFTSTPDPGDFAALVQALEVRPLTVPVAVTGTDHALQQVAAAADAGYTAFPYLTRLGEETAAWFRGPLGPAPITPNPQPAYPAAAAALMYDPATGMFDASYAAAWEIGRLLTLANGAVALSIARLAAGVVKVTRILLRDTGGAAPPTPALIAAEAASTARGRAVELIARTVPALLTEQSTSPAALGVRGDPHGLRGVDLPGLIDPEVLQGLYDEGPAVYRRVRDHALSTAAGGPADDPGSPGSTG